jgi:hypothetical protein
MFDVNQGNVSLVTATLNCASKQLNPLEDTFPRNTFCTVMVHAHHNFQISGLLIVCFKLIFFSSVKSVVSLPAPKHNGADYPKKSIFKLQYSQILITGQVRLSKLQFRLRPVRLSNLFTKLDRFGMNKICSLLLNGLA